MSIFHSLLSAEADGNEEIKFSEKDLVSEESFSAQARAIDLSDFYRESQFQCGDYIKVSVVDNLKGKCEIAHYGLALMQCDPGRITKWNEAFEKALGKAVAAQKKMGELFSNQDLLAMAFVLGGEKLLSDPPSNWLDAVKNSKKYQIQPGLSAEKALVWSNKGLHEYLTDAIQSSLDDEMEEIDEDFDFFSESAVGRQETMENLMKVMEFDLCPTDIKAYMLDAIHCGGDLDEVKNRCFDGRLEEYPDLIPILERELEILWRKAKNTPAAVRTLPCVKFRHDLLKLKDRQLAFVRELADQPSFGLTELLGSSFRPFQELCVMLDVMLIRLVEEPVNGNRDLQMISSSIQTAQQVFAQMENELRSQYLGKH